MRSSVSVTQVGNGPRESAGPSPKAAEFTAVEPGEHAAIDARSLDEAPIATPVIPLHDLAGIFPTPDAASIRELARRIGDKILDRAALYLACRMVGRAPTFETYAGDNPIEFLINRHLYRGPLSEMQRGMAAARAANRRPLSTTASRSQSIYCGTDCLRPRSVRCHFDRRC
jgi:hypothetical protein